MSDYNPSVDYHLSQLRQVAADLRAERMLAKAPARRSSSGFRIAIGDALMHVKSTLVANQARPSVQAR